MSEIVALWLGVTLNACCIVYNIAFFLGERKCRERIRKLENKIELLKQMTEGAENENH